MAPCICVANTQASAGHRERLARRVHVWTVAFGSQIDDRLMEQATKGLGTYEKGPDSSGLTSC